MLAASLPLFFYHHCRAGLQQGGQTVGSIVRTGTYIEAAKSVEFAGGSSKVPYLVHW